jgi:hypothetical protein
MSGGITPSLTSLQDWWVVFLTVLFRSYPFEGLLLEWI